MKKRLALLFIIALVVIQVASAYDTNIKIRTVPKYEVQVSVMDFSDSGTELLQAFRGYANNQTGYISFDFSSEETTFDLMIFIKNKGVTVIQERKEDFTAGTPIYLELAPKWFNLSTLDQKTIVAVVNNTPQVEVTINQTINESQIIIPVTEAVTEESSSTGYTVAEDNSFISKELLFYILLGLILAGAVFLVIIKKKSGNKKKNENDLYGDEKTYAPKQDIVVRKLSEVRKSDAQKLQEAEKKIQEAQEEINRIKNTDRIKQQRINDARKKLIADEQELMRLRKGDN